jgi:hypothetical protein
MATRADFDLSQSLVKEKTSGGAIAEGRAVKFGTSDQEVLQCGAGEKASGIAISAVDATGKRLEVLTLGGPVKVKVGTGGATRGTYAVCVADGLANIPSQATGSTARQVVGEFTQTGVAGDVVGLMFRPFLTFTA